jgi:hypothetical protein
VASYGQQTIYSSGRSASVSVDGRPECKVGGVTIDWSVVVAASADTSFDDNFTVKSGEKYLKRGQVLCLITAGEINTLTVTGTGGTYTLSLGGQTTTALAFGANAAAIQAALVALSSVGAGNATVTSTGPWTIAFATGLGDTTLTVDPASLTGGTATVATTSVGARNDLYGPYDSAAVDGRQTLTKGATFILNKSVKENDQASDHAGVAVYGGLLWKDRVRAHATTASLANGPTFATLEAVLPRVQWNLIT